MEVFLELSIMIETIPWNVESWDSIRSAKFPNFTQKLFQVNFLLQSVNQVLPLLFHFKQKTNQDHKFKSTNGLDQIFDACGLQHLGVN